MDSSRKLWCCPCQCLYRVFVGLFNMLFLSIRWRKNSTQRNIYFLFCFTQLCGAALLTFAAVIFPQNYAFNFKVVGLLHTLFVAIFSLSSFSIVPLSILYSIFSYFFITAGFYLLYVFIETGDYHTPSNGDAVSTQFLHYIPHFKFATYLVICGNCLVVTGYCGCVSMSVSYHWLIFKVGTTKCLCCITKCNGRCASLMWCCLCCRKREIRLLFNVVSLYHKTNTHAAQCILNTQKFRPGKEGWAGGGIYFAATPPSTEGKARVAPEEDSKMLKATVRLGKSLKVGVNGITEWPGLSYTTTAEEMRAYLDKRGYDSVWIPMERPEFVIYDPEQAEDIRESLLKS